MHGFDRDEWFTAAWRPSGSARRAGLAGVVGLHVVAALAWWQLPPSSSPRVTPPRTTPRERQSCTGASYPPARADTPVTAWVVVPIRFALSG